MLTDLTERRAAEERLEQANAELQATLESTADGILVTDLAGRIRAFNRRFAEIWAIPPTATHTVDFRSPPTASTGPSDPQAWRRRK